MRRIWKRIGALALGAALLLTSLTVGAGAAEVSSVTMETRPNVTILVDGAERTFYNAQGQGSTPCTIRAPTTCLCGPSGS